MGGFDILEMGLPEMFLAKQRDSDFASGSEAACT